LPPYTTPAEIRKVLSDPEDPATAGALEDTQLQVAATEAQVEIDARLAGKYATPFDNPPPLIRSVARDVAAYLATLTFRKGVAMLPGDPVGLRWSRANGILTDLQKGNITLEEQLVPTDERPPSLGGVVVNPDDSPPSRGRMFTRSDFDIDDEGQVGLTWPGERLGA
jgi:phage gp36-like protein